MFEGMKARTLEQKIRIQRLEIEETLLKDLTQGNTILPESDSAEWQTLGKETEKELDTRDAETLREQAIKTYYKNGHGRNIIRLFEKYVVGRGFQIIPESVEPEVKEYWDEFWKINKMDLRKKEIVRRTMRDGEAFLIYFEKEKNLSVRFMNPDHIADPDDSIKRDGSTTFGIETDKDDIEKVLAYWYKGKRLDTEDVAIQHLKILVDSDVKRGRSYYEPLLQNLAYYNTWLKDRMKLNKIRATLGIIKRVKGNPTTAANIKTAQDTTDKLNADGTPMQRAPEGVSVYTANQGVDYEMMSPNMQASDVRYDGRAILLAIAAGSGLPEFMISCFDDKTEILTENGFIKYDEYNSEKIATLNMETQVIEYQYPIQRHVYKYKGEMAHFKNTNIDVLVTLNHRMYCRTSIRGKFKFEFARDALKGYRRFLMSVNPALYKSDDIFILPEVQLYGCKKNQQTGERKIDKDVWAAFIGWFVSEGCCYNPPEKKHADYATILVQKDKKNQKIIEAMLDKMPFKWSKQESRNMYRIYDKALWTWCIENCGDKSVNKKLPNISWSSYQKQLLLEALILGDGHPCHKHFVYTTASTLLADQVQILSYELGWQSKKFGPMGPYGFGKEKIYRTKMYKLYESRAFPHHCKIVEYDGEVWCFTTENKTLITRRNGRISVQGNSDASNSSYSSTMIAEAPGIMEFEDWQDFFGEAFTEMFRIVIAFGIEQNEIRETEIIKHEDILPDGSVEEVEESQPTSLECIVTFPDLISRDVEKETRAYVMQSNQRWISDETASARLDLDFEDEQQLIKAKEDAEEPEEEDITDEEEEEMEEEPGEEVKPKQEPKGEE